MENAAVDQIAITNNEGRPHVIPGRVMKDKEGKPVLGPNRELQREPPVTIFPGGDTLVDIDVWNAAEELPVIKGLLKEPATVMPPARPNKMVKALVKGKVIKGGGGIESLDEAEAIELVQRTSMMPTLRGWKKSEKRDGVRAAIDARIKDIDESTRKPSGQPTAETK